MTLLAQAYSHRHIKFKEELPKTDHPLLHRALDKRNYIENVPITRIYAFSMKRIVHSLVEMGLTFSALPSML